MQKQQPEARDAGPCVKKGMGVIMHGGLQGSNAESIALKCPTAEVAQDLSKALLQHTTATEVGCWLLKHAFIKPLPSPLGRPQIFSKSMREECHSSGHYLCDFMKIDRQKIGLFRLHWQTVHRWSLQ